MAVYRWLAPLAPLASTLYLAAAACDPQSCTTAGCGTTLQLGIEGPGGSALPDSTYEIILDLDGSPYSTVCGSPEPGMFQCEPVEGPPTPQVTAFTTTTGTILIEVNADEGQGDGPQQVALSVIAGDAPLVDESWSVTYETLHPNGEECGPVCRTATEFLVATVAPTQ